MIQNFTYLLKLLSTILITNYNITSFDVGFGGSIYVLSKENNMLIKYSSKGDSLAAIGGFGHAEYGFDSPSAVVVNQTDIYVADYNNHRIQRFNRDLNYISTISLHDQTNELERFGYPIDLAVLRSGNLAILDGENMRIIIATPFGQWLNTYASKDSRKKLNSPKSIKTDNDDNLYILDNNDILMFNSFGIFIKTISFPNQLRIESFTIKSGNIYALSGNNICLYNIENQAVEEIYSLPNDIENKNKLEIQLSHNLNKTTIQFEEKFLISSGNLIVSYNLR